MFKSCFETNAGLEAKDRFRVFAAAEPRPFSGRAVAHVAASREGTGVRLKGPAKEVLFAQQHPPGRLGASDFTHMEELGVTIQGQSFPHLIYHFVLTYSNWETGTVVLFRRALRA